MTEHAHSHPGTRTSYAQVQANAKLAKIRLNARLTIQSLQ